MKYKEHIKRNVLILVASEWGYTKGGINVFNRLLCESLGKNYSNWHMIIVCVAPNAIQEDVENAKKIGIDLVGISREQFELAEVVYKTVVGRYNKTDNFTWIGHDTYSDSLAIECNKLSKRDNLASRSGIIHHMSYKSYYDIENISIEACEKKYEHQKKMLTEADIVFANGPFLVKSAKDITGNKKEIHQLKTGIKTIDFDGEKTFFDVVAFGRVEAPTKTKKGNSIIKQIYLAVAAYANFVKENIEEVGRQTTSMTVYGKDQEGGDETLIDKQLERLADDYGDGIQKISLYPYEENREKLLKKW